MRRRHDHARSDAPATSWPSWCARRRVTPDAGPALDVLERHLAPAGFAVERPVFEDAGHASRSRTSSPRSGSGERHLTLAGHVDVVPPGPEERWRHPPFSATIVDGVLYGRGAVDMKGGLAAMVVAALRFVGAARRGFRRPAVVPGHRRRGGRRRQRHARSCSNGRRRAASASPPRSSASRPAPSELGDQIKIGRRGSFSATLTVEGHAGPRRLSGAGRQSGARPDAAPPCAAGRRRSTRARSISARRRSKSSASMSATRPGTSSRRRATARFNSRYNDRWTRASAAAPRSSGGSPAPRPTPTLGARTPIRWRLDAGAGGVGRVPDARRDADRLDLRRDRERSPAGARHSPPAAARRMRASSRTIARSSSSARSASTMHQIDEHVPLAEIEQAARDLRGLPRRAISPM